MNPTINRIRRIQTFLETSRAAFVRTEAYQSAFSAVDEMLEEQDKIASLQSGKMSRQEILETAIKYVTKDRTATHGDPEDNFTTIAKFWALYLEQRGAIKGMWLGPVDVAVMMVLMKIARILISPQHADHWVDIAGYSACGGGIATEAKGLRQMAAETRVQPCNTASEPISDQSPDKLIGPAQAELASKMGHDLRNSLLTADQVLLVSSAVLRPTTLSIKQYHELNKLHDELH